MSPHPLEARLEAIVRAAPSLVQVLETARELALPDWLIFSGAIYQRVLNHLTGRDPDYGIKDYDLGYFDPSDTSYEAEDIDEDSIAAELQTRGLPELDLLIRTSGEVRLSNFLLWQAAYAELLFLGALWPDFDEASFATALKDYAARDRRFGGR